MVSSDLARDPAARVRRPDCGQGRCRERRSGLAAELGARRARVNIVAAGPALCPYARATFGRLKNGFYGLETMLVMLVFLALLREPRAEGATRVPPAALGRVLGLDRAREVKTIRRKLGELAGAGKAAELMMALARHHAAARPEALGFLYVDGHARAYSRDARRAEDARGAAEVSPPRLPRRLGSPTRTAIRCWW